MAGADGTEATGTTRAWAGKPQWRILVAGSNAALNFLLAWRAWKDDPNRPRMLHVVMIEPLPVSQAAMGAIARAHPELAPVAGELAAQWFGLMPGSHRLAFEQGHVLLTLHVNDLATVLRRERFTADCVMLDTVDPASVKAIARHCERGATFSAPTASDEAIAQLEQCGFVISAREKTATSLTGQFMPSWEPKKRPGSGSGTATASTCIVIGGGLAGSAVAASLARRGWSVCVMDAAAQPAFGASGAPVAMLAPHFSPDDSMLSRLSRAGVRMTLQQAREHLADGRDFSACGILELRDVGPHTFTEAQAPWSRPVTNGLWHEQAAWIKPAALVASWLAESGVQWRGICHAGRCVHDAASGAWIVLDSQGAELGRAELIVVAASVASGELASEDLPLQPVRGQISWGTQAASALPPYPVNGNGHLIPSVPLAGGAAWAWYCGSTFDRADASMDVRQEDHAANLDRLRQLLPGAASAIENEFINGTVQAWTGVRCASSNRRPLVGQLHPGMWVSTAMGSRGLTFCVLCAEILAARLHDEPLPIETRLADALTPLTPLTP